MKSNTTIGRLRIAGITEGISFLVLLFIAMPLKYVLHIPQPVKIIGWIHGFLFILYILAIAHATAEKRWVLRKTMIAFIAAFIPFGPFLIDKKLKAEENE